MTTPDTLRLFVALPLDPATRRGIDAFRARNPGLGGEGFRWTRTRNLHLTVFFLGSVASGNLSALTEALTPVLTGASPLNLSFDLFSVEPPRRPRMIWARYRVEPAFTALSHAVAGVCKPFLLTPTKHHSKPVPHITVARLKKPIPLPEQSGLGLPVFEAEQAELWCSQPGERGVVYEHLSGWTLGEKP